MRRVLRNNGLSLVLFGAFVVFWAGQAIAGFLHHNEERTEHQQAPITFSEYVRGGEFWEATSENWESEFFQMAAFIVLTAVLRQKGSPESRGLDGEDEVDREPRPHPGAPRPVHRGGWALALYSRSLSLALIGLFVFSFCLHALTGRAAYNEEQRSHGQPTVSMGAYVGSSRFWFESLQNWQSEFLSVGMLVVLGVFLRQKGSPESKPVDASHSETGG